MINLQVLGDQLILQLHHVLIAVLREAHAQAVARLARLPVADVVGEDEEVVRGVEQLTGAEQLFRELRREELRAGAAGAVQDEDGVRGTALRILLQRAERAVVQPHFVELFPGRKRDVAEDGVVLRHAGLS